MRSQRGGDGVVIEKCVPSTRGTDEGVWGSVNKVNMGEAEAFGYHRDPAMPNLSVCDKLQSQARATTGQ